MTIDEFRKKYKLRFGMSDTGREIDDCLRAGVKLTSHVSADDPGREIPIALTSINGTRPDIFSDEWIDKDWSLIPDVPKRRANLKLIIGGKERK